jgi:hypothetical protein
MYFLFNVKNIIGPTCMLNQPLITFPENAVWPSPQRGDRGLNSGTEAAQSFFGISRSIEGGSN